MNQSVNVRTKRQGSYDILVPTDDTGRIFARLSGTSDHLNKPTLAAMKALGYQIVVQQEQRSV